MTAEIKQDVRARNLELAREVLVVYERGGLEGMLAEFETYFAPDFEWTPGMVALGRSTYRGRDGYARYVSELAATSVDTKMVDYELRAVGEDMVLILGRLCIVGRESGVPLENEYAMLYRAEGGLLKAGWSFLSHEEAEAKARELEAASQDA